MGPAVSWLWKIGIIPARLTNPTVGLIPARPFDDDGQTNEPSVTVPIPIAARFSAMETASGFISIIAFTVRLSMSSMRAVYFSTSDLAVNLPDFIPSCNSEMVISSRSNGFTSAAEDSAAREISRAELNAGRKATAAEAIRVVCRNPRRDEPELERMSVQWRSRLNAGRLFKHECPQEFTIPAR